MCKNGGGRSGTADRAFFLQAFNGGPNVVDRVGRGTVAIDNLALTLCGGIRPDRLRQFGDLTDDGLWQRFIPITMQAAWLRADCEAEDVPEEYAAVVQRLLATTPQMRMELCNAAHVIREEVEHRAHALEAAEAISAGFTGFVGKLHGLWGRLALVLSQVEAGGFPSIVPLDAAEAARTLIFESAVPNAARVYTEMGGGGRHIEATLHCRVYPHQAQDAGNRIRPDLGRSRLPEPILGGGAEARLSPRSWRLACARDGIRPLRVEGE